MGLMTSRPDYVLTINFNSAISGVCELLKIPYLSWVIDTPCYPIYNAAINNSQSFTFLYDAAIATRLRGKGVRQVYHLPVAANPERIDQIQLQPEDDVLRTDISFVGNLTRTEYRALIMSRLSEGTRARCEKLIRSLDPHPVAFELADHIDDNLLEAIKAESGYLLAGEHYLSVAEKLAYLLAREHSWHERIALIKQLGSRFYIRVYGNKEWEGQINCYAGHADHFSLMPKIFQLSKININLSRSFVECGLPMRIFDVLSCGGFLLTNDKNDLQQLFTDGKDLVVFRDVKDLNDICEYYLEHQDERRAIAQHGHATLAERHTFLLRMIDMFSAVQCELRGEPVPMSRWYA